jgi:hypothetical protein
MFAFFSCTILRVGGAARRNQLQFDPREFLLERFVESFSKFRARGNRDNQFPFLLGSLNNLVPLALRSRPNGLRQSNRRHCTKKKNQKRSKL